MLAFCINTASAGEGMWLPQLLKALNEGEMQSMGMKLTAEDIYSVNKGSLKDAIVHFGGFCTGEVISDQGLLLTNHHCGYGQIQSHSSIDNNMLKNGFWAASHADELPNPGLFAKFINRIDDVSMAALKGVTADMDEATRQSTIDANINEIKKGYELGDFQAVEIKPFFKGNQYFAFVTTVYNDVRLVGTPPESIGKFGADTDNWEWPRHTGDFSLFRIYAGPNNEPANYSADNKPYTPKHSLPISLDGVSEGDFTMIFGFPGRTNQYLPSDAVEQITYTRDPAKIAVRDAALKILDKYMREDEAIKIKYASKFASVANYWKKWIGESQGIIKTDGIGRKEAYEAEFQKRAVKAGKYTDILPKFESLYASTKELALVDDVFGETAYRNVELLRLMGTLNRLVTRYESNGQDAYDSYKSRVLNYLQGYYKNYESKVDKDVAKALLDLYKETVPVQYVPASLQGDGVVSSLVDKMYSQSKFTSLEGATELLNMDTESAISAIKSDPAFMLSRQWSELIADKVDKPLAKQQDEINQLMRTYMAAQMELFPEKRFYPDANSTMRVTYGNVDGYYPKDGVYYMPKTYLDGVIAKYVPGDYEFDVDQKLIELHKSKDYGQYTDETGKVPVCFLGSNHTTGGNSGSPAIDAYGNLIGLNFDRVWEGTMSDLNYDVSICRNIMVDARYILFVIDKFAGAEHLIKEMKLVRPKAKK